MDAEIDSFISDVVNKGKARQPDSEITRADPMDMLKMQKDMLRQSTLESQSLRKTILAMSTKPTTTGATEPPICTAARKMVDPAKFCGGAQDLDRFLPQLKYRFKTQPHQFHEDADQVDYALSLLGKWTNNDEVELRKTQMTNPAERGTSLVTMTSPCLASFELFEAGKMYGDKDRQLNPAIKAATEFLQGHIPAEPNETAHTPSTTTCIARECQA